MTNDKTTAASSGKGADSNTRTKLSKDAKNALAEAKARQNQADQNQAASRQPTEKGGRGGLDPARYGDWEVKGITSDF